MNWHVVTTDELPVAGAGVSPDTGEVIVVYPDDLSPFVGLQFSRLLGWMASQPGFKHTDLG